LIEVLKYFFQSIEHFFKKGIFTGKGPKFLHTNNIYKFNGLEKFFNWDHYGMLFSIVRRQTGNKKLSGGLRI